MHPPYFTIALTGQMASGKTTAANYFSSLGASVLDADEIAQTYMLPNTFIWQQLQDKLPADYFTTQGFIQRPKLRQRLVEDPTLLHWLEQQIHPLVAQKMYSQCQIKPPCYYLLVIPLLYTPHAVFHYHRSCLIRSNNQHERLKKRHNYDASMYALALKQRPYSNARSDDLIENTGSLEQLYQTIDPLHQHYLTLSHQANTL